MNEDGGKRVPAKRCGEEVDRISNLPDSLKFEIHMKLRTKEVVKTSVLSSSWRNLWRFVPRLEFDFYDILDDDLSVSFVDNFLCFNNESRLQDFKLLYELDEDTHLTKWINTVVERKVEHLNLGGNLCYEEIIKMPQILYTCESLVSLKLGGKIELAIPNFVSLPCLKDIRLLLVRLTGDSALETLISGCPVLESLFIVLSSVHDDIEVLRVRSQSLLTFTYGPKFVSRPVKDLVIVIDSPRLENIWINAHGVASFELKNMSSLKKVRFDISFNLSSGKKFDPNDLPKRNVVRNFLLGISNVKDMTITSSTLGVIYDYSRCQRLPLFRNISSLCVKFDDYRWEMLPIFLERCINLKSLVVESTKYPKEGISIVSGPRCLLKSLEYVNIERPLKREEMEMKLVSYFLENSTILKKLTLCLDNSVKENESVILKELLTIPRISANCQIVVL